MPKDPQKFAKLFKAKLVGQVPNVGGGPFGMARLAHLMHQRLTPSQGERPGRPTDASWQSRPKVPMSETTKKRLAEIAAQMSTPERCVSSMQVAAHLLEEAVNRVPTGTETHGEGIKATSEEGAENGPTPSEPLIVKGTKQAKLGKGKENRREDKARRRRRKK